MRKSFFIKESVTEILTECIQSNKWVLYEYSTDAVFASNYVPQGNCAALGRNCNSKLRQIRSLYEIRNSQTYWLMDKDFYSYATLCFTENGFTIQTAWSAFLYQFEITQAHTYEGKWIHAIKCTYKGSTKGFLAQQLLPTLTELEGVYGPDEVQR